MSLRKKYEPIIGRPEVYNAKVEEFVKAGKQALYVMSDFDSTLTPDRVDGESSPAIVGEIGKGEYISSRHAKEDKRLAEKYYPMSYDPALTLAEKTLGMETWWRKHIELMIEEGAQKQMFIDAATQSNHGFRDLAHELFQFTDTHDIPFVVFSAGLTIMIEELFNMIDVPTEHAFVVSNDLGFDENDYLTGYVGDIIHIFNKNSVKPNRVQGLEDALAGRTHVIVMGDSLGDLPMMEQFPHEHVLKIGFYNHLTDDILEHHVAGFDVVLPDDGDLRFVLELLRQIG